MRESRAPQTQVPRISSGTPHLDQILCGGWLRGGIYIVSGPPGTGKTTLANQLGFAVGERGEQAVYVTMAAETHARMMLHLESLAFFRRDLVGTHVHYLSGAATLKESGLPGLLDLLRRAVRERNARTLVIDGFEVVREKAASKTEVREFLQALSAFASLIECTSFLLSTTETSKATDVEFAVVDGILALSADLLGLKATRGVEVLKYRGSNILPGKHTFVIDERGFRVFPRWESCYRHTSERVTDVGERLGFGLPSLDEMCHGGLLRFSSTLLMGSPGGGKTLLGMCLLAEGARRGEPGLYLGFAENAEQILLRASGVGLDLRGHVERGMLRMETRAPVETLPDELVQQLMEMIDQHHYKRVFIDGLEPFANEAIDPERITRFVAALLNALRDREVTALFTQQTNDLFGPQLHAPIRGIEAICDNVMFLRFFEMGGRLCRVISVLKMRDSANDPFLRELRITSRGIDVGGTFAEVEASLTGQPRARPGASAAARAQPPAPQAPAEQASKKAARSTQRSPEKGARSTKKPPKKAAGSTDKASKKVARSRRGR